MTSFSDRPFSARRPPGPQGETPDISLADLIAERDALARLRALRGRKPNPAGRSLAWAIRRAVGDALDQPAPAASVLTARWSEIVGPKLATLTQPVEVKKHGRGAVLVLRAPPAAAPMIQHAETSILERVSLATGVKVTSLRILQTAAPAVAASRPRPRALTAAELAGLHDGLDAIGTPEIRLALQRLGEAVLSQRPQRSGDD